MNHFCAAVDVDIIALLCLWFTIKHVVLLLCTRVKNIAVNCKKVSELVFENSPTKNKLTYVACSKGRVSGLKWFHWKHHCKFLCTFRNPIIIFKSNNGISGHRTIQKAFSADTNLCWWITGPMRQLPTLNYWICVKIGAPPLWIVHNEAH